MHRKCFEGGEYTAYADVWSAGCIFIEMLTQHNPWQYQYGEKVTFEEI
jgi:serine/threonine protein kinase